MVPVVLVMVPVTWRVLDMDMLYEDTSDVHADWRRCELCLVKVKAAKR